MQRSFTSLLAAVATVSALTFTAMAVPARAGNNDEFAKFVAGALTLYMLGQVIDGNVTVTRQSQPNTLASPFDRDRSHYGYRDRIIPDVCVFEIRDRHSRSRIREVVGRDCLKNTLRGRRDLPGQCKDEIRLRHNSKLDVYDMRCLRRFGYRVAGRRD